MTTSEQSRTTTAPDRLLSARRALWCLAAGLVVGAVVAAAGAPRLAPLATWTAAVALLLTWVWARSWPQDPAGTERLAEQERTTRSTDVWLTAASVASLGIVALALVQSSSRRDPVSVAAVLLSVASVVLSWLLVNTVYAFKYARTYYLDGPGAGGISFNQDEEPSYSDFAYMAFTIGMSYAVSDTEPACTAIRRVALGHALLSYAFGTGVLAVAINLVTNLGQ